MKNDAKLGMLAGVLGVIVAAVLFANTPPPTAQSRPGAADPPAKEKPAPPTVATAPEANTAALPSTPVARTRKDVDAQPTSRAGGEEEP
jgi:hypothetical protein